MVTDYNELDELKIKETINNYVTNDTNFYNVLRFIRLLEKEYEELDLEMIDKKIIELNKYLYDYKPDAMDNITISEEIDIPKIIVEKYKMNSIIVDEASLNLGSIKKTIESVDKLLIYFDIYNLMMNLQEIKFVIDVPDELK